MILCIWVISSVTFKAFELYWSFIFPEYQLSCSIKLKFWTRASLFQNIDILMNIFKFSENFQQINMSQEFQKWIASQAGTHLKFNFGLVFSFWNLFNCSFKPDCVFMKMLKNVRSFPKFWKFQYKMMSSAILQLNSFWKRKS